MGLLCEFDVCADFGFIDQTEEFGIVPDYSTGCEIFCETFLQVSRNLVPVDTGYLRSTLSASYSDTYCSAETICEYAQYVEYGTWKQIAQPYFEPAIEEALNAAEPYWIEAQEEALQEEAELIEEMEEEEAAQQSQSAIAQWGGMLLGSLFSALIITFIHEVIGFAFTESGNERRSAQSGGGGSIFLPDIIII